MVVTSGGASCADPVSLPIKATAAAEDSVASMRRRFCTVCMSNLPVISVATGQPTAGIESTLQLALELVEEAPIRSVSDDLVGARFDHAHFAQPQRKKPERVFGIVVPPLVVWDF